ncbi:uncharacterized protein IWZ02DRAFT_4393 [Phyllosticta citriasiana]|uniref:uncharacterized protein n=1 Tax=Phyllosticta citriasiana TaxID=595635 RepID=UPI0030FDD9FC
MMMFLENGCRAAPTRSSSANSCPGPVQVPVGTACVVVSSPEVLVSTKLTVSTRPQPRHIHPPAARLLVTPTATSPPPVVTLILDLSWLVFRQTFTCTSSHRHVVSVAVRRVPACSSARKTSHLQASKLDTVAALHEGQFEKVQRDGPFLALPEPALRAECWPCSYPATTPTVDCDGDGPQTSRGSKGSSRSVSAKIWCGRQATPARTPCPCLHR